MDKEEKAAAGGGRPYVADGWLACGRGRVVVVVGDADTTLENARGSPILLGNAWHQGLMVPQVSGSGLGPRRGDKAGERDSHRLCRVWLHGQSRRFVEWRWSGCCARRPTRGSPGQPVKTSFMDGGELAVALAACDSARGTGMVWDLFYPARTTGERASSVRGSCVLEGSPFSSDSRGHCVFIADAGKLTSPCHLERGKSDHGGGLVWLVWTLNAVVAIVTSALVGISTLFFLSTTLLPSFFDLCALCSPQSWLCFYLSRRIRRIFDQAATSAVYSFTDTWMDICLDVLSRPSESKAYEIRGLFWVQTALGSWEPSLSAVLYRCAATLPATDTARVIHRFWKRSTPACDLPTASNQFLHVGKLWTAIGSDTYWQLYAHLLDSIRSNNGHPNQDDSIIVFCSLHLILCRQGYGSRPEKVQLLLAGLSHLAKILFQDGITVPHDTELVVASILSYVAAQEDLDLLYMLYMDEEALSCLDSFTAECSCHGLHPTFPTLSSICFRMQWNHHRSTGGSLMELLSAMQLALQSQKYPEGVTVAISQWVSRGFERLVIDSWDTELALSFRKLYDGGLALPAAVVEHIDVLIVHICSPEVVCETLSTAIYSGVEEPFSETNMSWWADRLEDDRHQVLRHFCNQFPPLKPLPTPTPSHIAHLRIICEAAPIWLWHSYAVDEMITSSLSIVLAFCRLNVPDLANWFPRMTSPDVFLAKVSEQLVSCIMKPGYQIEEPNISDDPTLFIALTSSSLDLAFLCAPFPTAELVTEFGNLLETVTAFVRLCTFSGTAKEHVALNWIKTNISDFQNLLQDYFTVRKTEGCAPCLLCRFYGFRVMGIWPVPLRVGKKIQRDRLDQNGPPPEVHTPAGGSSFIMASLGLCRECLMILLFLGHPKDLFFNLS
ncbi:hypothetical protein B0H14DRAFT_3729992 [Mycena olivaceomarginata]|nr:hypothetical protein B0H14DRAFT_3729992 [Mycena olivaceomarginata]